MNTHECHKCSATMEAGFIVERSFGNWQDVSIGGKPEHSLLRGVKLLDKPQLKVVTFRCPKCGLLESYASEPVSWKIA